MHRSFATLRMPLILLQICFMCWSVQARDERYRFTLDLGHRWRSGFAGNEDLYRSQLDYDQGLRLFGGDFFVSAPQGQNTYFDRIQLRMDSWGGEPHRRASFRMDKANLYELRFDHHSAQYFNAVPSFANPFFEQGILQTQHRFDVAQERSDFELRLLPGRRFAPFLGFARGERDGANLTTISEGGNEFLLTSRQDHWSNDYRAGFDVRLRNFSLLLEQGIRHYRDRSDYQASGFQQGNVLRPILGRPTNLDQYNARHQMTANIPFSNGSARFQPWETLSLRARVSYSMANLSPNFSDQAAGNFFSFPLSAFYGGSLQQTVGTVKKPNLFGDFSADWRPFDRLRLLESFSTRRFHVSGSAFSNNVFLQVDPLLELGIRERVGEQTPFNTRLSMDYDIQQLQGIFFLTPRFMARLGHRWEHREVDVAPIVEGPLDPTRRVQWDRHVLLAGLGYDFTRRTRVALEYEYGVTDSAIVRTDTVDFHRARLRGSYSPFASLEVHGSATLFNNQNDLENIDFTARERDYSLQLTYTPLRRVTLIGDYSRNRIHTSILYIVPQTFLTDRFFYRERGDYGSLYVSLLLFREATVNLGYSTWSTVGDFPLNYHRPMARVEVPIHNRVSAYGQWNFYDYGEKLQTLPLDYRTHLAVLGFRVRLDQ
jgi:hypothetical protein